MPRKLLEIKSLSENEVEVSEFFLKRVTDDKGRERVWLDENATVRKFSFVADVSEFFEAKEGSGELYQSPIVESFNKIKERGSAYDVIFQTYKQLSTIRAQIGFHDMILTCRKYHELGACSTLDETLSSFERGGEDSEELNLLVDYMKSLQFWTAPELIRALDEEFRYSGSFDDNNDELNDECETFVNALGVSLMSAYDLAEADTKLVESFINSGLFRNKYDAQVKQLLKSIFNDFELLEIDKVWRIIDYEFHIAAICLVNYWLLCNDPAMIREFMDELKMRAYSTDEIFKLLIEKHETSRRRGAMMPRRPSRRRRFPRTENS